MQAQEECRRFFHNVVNARLWRRRGVLALGILLSAVLLFSGNAVAMSTDYDVLDAEQRGVFNIGPGDGTVDQFDDPASGTKMLKFDYTIPKGSVIGVWTKDYPRGLDNKSVSNVALGVRVMGAKQVHDISVKVEIKGTKAVQTIPLKLSKGLNAYQEEINWNLIGVLNEVVFVVLPKSEQGPVAGTLYFSCAFLPKVAAPVQEAVVQTVTNAQAVAEVQASSRSFNLLDAKKRQAISSEGASGRFIPTLDQVSGKDVLDFSYTIPQGEVTGVRAYKFPAALQAKNVNAIRIGVRIPQAAQADEIIMSLALQGSEETQVIPLTLKAGWNTQQALIDWALIGKLKEVEFRLHPAEGEQLVRGSMYLSLSVFQSFTMGTAPSPAEDVSLFNLLDVNERGVFNIGDAQGTIACVFDELVARDVFAFDFEMPKDTIIGVWTKSYPTAIQAGQVDALTIGVNVPDPTLIPYIAVTAEVKGQKGLQRIPLELKPGWNTKKEIINWGSIGPLSEVVYVVTRRMVAAENAKEVVTGTLGFDLDFAQLSIVQKYFTYVRIGLVLLLAWFLSLLMIPLKGFLMKKPDSLLGVDTQQSFFGRLRRDMYHGFVAANSPVRNIF